MQPELPVEDISGIRLEKVAAQFVQLLLPFLSAIAMFYLAAKARDAQDLALSASISVLGWSTGFFTGRMDFIIHRIELHLRLIGSAYEVWKAENRRVLGLIVYDLGTSAAVIVAFLYCQQILNEMHPTHLLWLGMRQHTWYVLNNWMFALSILSVPLAPIIAGNHKKLRKNS